MQAYARKQLSVARQLFSIGMEVNPQHGPIYHAFGNMELVRLSFPVLLIISLVNGLI